MLVSSFNLLQSFNYAPYLLCKKQVKSEINCFCIRPRGTFIHSYIHTFIHKYSARPISLSSLLSSHWLDLHGMQSRDSNLGLTYSKLMHHHLSYNVP